MFISGKDKWSGINVYLLVPFGTATCLSQRQQEEVTRDQWFISGAHQVSNSDEGRQVLLRQGSHDDLVQINKLSHLQILKIKMCFCHVLFFWLLTRGWEQERTESQCCSSNSFLQRTSPAQDNSINSKLRWDIDGIPCLTHIRLLTSYSFQHQWRKHQREVEKWCICCPLFALLVDDGLFLSLSFSLSLSLPGPMQHRGLGPSGGLVRGQSTVAHVSDPDSNWL